MYINQLSLTNQRIRNALRQYDSETVAEAVLILLNGDEDKANQLGNWFRSVALSCKKGMHMNEDVAMMRMWQLGNIDIKGIENNGEPLFVLTFSGSEAVKAWPKTFWFYALLENDASKAA